MPPSQQMPLPEQRADNAPRTVLPARAGDAPRRPKGLRHIHDAFWSGHYMNCAACVAELDAEASARTLWQHLPPH
jgi:hypothetical protein